jgi:hypothetical protein
MIPQLSESLVLPYRAAVSSSGSGFLDACRLALLGGPLRYKDPLIIKAAAFFGQWAMEK